MTYQKDNSKVRLVALIRVSTPGQENRHGKERQERFEIESYAEELGATIVDTWAIRERATVFDRPQFESCLRRAIDLRESGEIDGLILGSVDRLSRDAYDGSALCREALRNRLLLFFADERLDVRNESDQDRIIGAFQAARAYVNRLKRQTIPARRARAGDGKIPNGQHRWPFDYDAESGRAKPNPIRASWVQRWVEILARGGKLSDVITMMRDNGVPAPKGGTTWGRSTIVRILRCPSLKGEFFAEKERMVAPSFHEKSVREKVTPKLIYTDKENSILDDYDWRRIQKILDGNRELSRRNTKIDYSPLQGLVWCHCGKKAGGYPLHGYPYFRCPVCKKPRVNARKLWDRVKIEMSRVLSNPERIIPVLADRLNDGLVQEELESKIALLEAELKGLEESLDRVFRSFIILPGFGEERAKREANRIDTRKIKVMDELTGLRHSLENLERMDIGLNQVQTLSEKFSQMLEGATNQEWQGLLTEFGVKLVLQPKAPHVIRTRIRLVPSDSVLQRS